MIRVFVREPAYPEWPSPNAFIYALDAWKEWAKGMGLTHLPGGSERTSLEPGQWCVQSYSRSEEIKYSGRAICFHEDDRIYAIIFKLTWGGR